MYRIAISHCILNPSSLAFLDSLTVIWPCIRDKLAHFDGFADDMISKISLAGVVAGKAGLVQEGVAAYEVEEASPVVLQRPRIASLPKDSGSSKMQLLQLEVQWVAVDVDMTC